MSAAIRIAIADNHAVFPISIATKYGFEVVAEADNGREFIAQVASYNRGYG